MAVILGKAIRIEGPVWNCEGGNTRWWKKKKTKLSTLFMMKFIMNSVESFVFFFFHHLVLPPSQFQTGPSILIAFPKITAIRTFQPLAESLLTGMTSRHHCWLVPLCVPLPQRALISPFV